MISVNLILTKYLLFFTASKDWFGQIFLLFTAKDMGSSPWFAGIRTFRQSMLRLPDTAGCCPFPTFLAEDTLLGIGWKLVVVGQGRIGSTPRATLRGKSSLVCHRLPLNLPRSVLLTTWLSGYQDYQKQW